uniref:gamma-aminobutyric acid type B receptor subunit 2-like isoform X2 n=1 Tax=Ciona intestinalis TaxID=7719 RepID=UPI000EF53131|nr:gamma-aminobutyric acid type B receptor subunit 2-like isoform X2 [Ciona intestinalis]|eukprot:XP_026696029.1 gamma-aminobutyric acid type B receptor subunit 2-like isoform X2 [Ciona intestinalis]
MFLKVDILCYVVASVFSFLGVIASVFHIVFIWTHYNSRWIKISSPNINIVVLFGSILMYLSPCLVGSSAFIRDIPTTEDVITWKTCCFAGICCFDVGFTLMFGSLAAKTWRIDKIFQQNSRKQVTDEKLLCAVFLLVCLEIVILIMWHIHDQSVCYFVQVEYVSGVYRLTKLLENHLSLLNEDFVVSCATAYTIIWVFCICAIKVSILGVTIWMAWCTKQLSKASFNDSNTHVVSSILALFVFCFSLPIVYLTPPNIQFIVFFTVVNATTVFIVSIQFIPKVLLTKSKKKNPPKQISIPVQEKHSSSNRGEKESQLNKIESLRDQLCEKDYLINHLERKLMRLSNEINRIYGQEKRKTNALTEKRKKEDKGEEYRGSTVSLPNGNTEEKYRSFCSQGSGLFTLSALEGRKSKRQGSNMSPCWQSDPHLQIKDPEFGFRPISRSIESDLLRTSSKSNSSGASLQFVGDARRKKGSMLVTYCGCGCYYCSTDGVNSNGLSSDTDSLDSLFVSALEANGPSSTKCAGILQYFRVIRSEYENIRNEGNCRRLKYLDRFSDYETDSSSSYDSIL